MTDMKQGGLRGPLERVVRLRPINERDWEEDFEHENGDYECRCVTCKLMFYGHKRRVVCRACSTKQPNPNSTADYERR